MREYGVVEEMRGKSKYKFRTNKRRVEEWGGREGGRDKSTETNKDKVGID